LALRSRPCRRAGARHALRSAERRRDRHRSCARYGHFGNDVQAAVCGSLSATGTVKITSVKCERVADAGIRAAGEKGRSD
jgi:hypothetical protein